MLFLKEAVGRTNVNFDNILVSTTYFFWNKGCFEYFVGCVINFNDDMKPLLMKLYISNRSIKIFDKVNYLPFMLEEDYQYIIKKRYEIKPKILLEIDHEVVYDIKYKATKIFFRK